MPFPDYRSRFMTPLPESRRGLIHGATAYVLWGLLPLYYSTDCD